MVQALKKKKNQEAAPLLSFSVHKLKQTLDRNEVVATSGSEKKNVHAKESDSGVLPRGSAREKRESKQNKQKRGRVFLCGVSQAAHLRRSQAAAREGCAMLPRPVCLCLQLRLTVALTWPALKKSGKEGTRQAPSLLVLDPWWQKGLFSGETQATPHGV